MGNAEWKGNSRATFATIGASNHTDKEREVSDFYATDSVAIDLLETAYRIPKNVWECCAGMGHLSEKLLATGHNVLSSDLHYRGYGKCRDGVDFLTARWPETMPSEDCCILTNPPYSLLCDMIEHAVEITPSDDIPVIMLVKTITLESKERYERLFSRGYLHQVFQFVERLQCAKNGEFGKYGATAVSYAWMVFKRRPCGAPTIHWLTRRSLSPANRERAGKTIEHDDRQLKLFE